ncbi:unnamed protein product [Linum tenue]|uniref:Uncharacterized protein n=1 Tax=Linum tenue TaxID=586396 RepID=A0AAV0QHH3_9ROSI|nr:unnamed protein product [Linum tenue]
MSPAKGAVCVTGAGGFLGSWVAHILLSRNYLVRGTVRDPKAETKAMEYAKANGLDVVSVCPNLIIGPLLKPTVNASTMVLAKLLKEGKDLEENKHHRVVDVRDVAEALVLVYEKLEAQGRYICTAHSIHVKEVVHILKERYPNYNYPKNFTEEEEKKEMSSERLQRLGWSYRSLEETLVDFVESYKKASLLE